MTTPGAPSPSPRVLMLGWEFPPRISGGLGTACLGLTRGLAALGVPVVFILPRTTGEEASGPTRILGCDDVPAAADPNGASLDIRAVPSSLRPYESREEFRRRTDPESGRPPPVPDVERAAPSAPPAPPQDLPDEVARYARAVGRIAAAEEYDIVHGHDWMTFPAATAAARLRGVPLVLHVHSSEIDRSGPRADPMLRAIEQRGLDDADAVICVSAYTARRLATHYRVDAAKVHVVHNAALLDGEAPPPRPRHLPEPVVLFLGRVTFQKGPAFFLEAAARVAAEHRTVRFVVAGGGDLLHPMIERAATLGLARRMHFTGFLGREDVERAFAAADVYVMPSVSEPFGIAALEAMARGVPVVLSRQSGAAEILRSPVKVDFWDTEETARRILELLRRPAMRARLAREGREEAGRLRWEGQAAMVKALYETLVA